MIKYECTKECWAMPECKVCGLTKKPIGRDPGIYRASNFCDEECVGYRQLPIAGHLWPEEEPTH